MITGQRHLIKCHCILPIYKNSKPQIYHKIAVYSMFDEKSGKVIPKYINCNNCGITHFVTEYCKSEIQIGKEDVTSIRSVSEVEIGLPEKLVSFLNQYSPTIDILEEIEHIFNDNLFPKGIIIKREIIDEKHNIKILNLINKNRFTISSEILDNTIIY